MAILKIRDKNGNTVNVPAIKGQSAYEIAKDNGFEGTEQEWLESLKGEPYKLTENDKSEIQDKVIEGLNNNTDRLYKHDIYIYYRHSYLPLTSEYSDGACQVAFSVINNDSSPYSIKRADGGTTQLPEGLPENLSDTDAWELLRLFRTLSYNNPKTHVGFDNSGKPVYDWTHMTPATGSAFVTKLNETTNEYQVERAISTCIQPYHIYDTETGKYTRILRIRATNVSSTGINPGLGALLLDIPCGRPVVENKFETSMWENFDEFKANEYDTGGAQYFTQHLIFVSDHVTDISTTISPALQAEEVWI